MSYENIWIVLGCQENFLHNSCMHGIYSLSLFRRNFMGLQGIQAHYDECKCHKHIVGCILHRCLFYLTLGDLVWIYIHGCTAACELQKVKSNTCQTVCAFCWLENHIKLAKSNGRILARLEKKNKWNWNWNMCRWVGNFMCILYVCVCVCALWLCDMSNLLCLPHVLFLPGSSS